VPTLERGGRQALLEAVAAGDAAVAVYLDLHTGRVLKVRAGVCSEPGLRAEDLERDEERFAEAPTATVVDDYLWAQEFVEQRGERRVTALLDGRKGAPGRFARQLAKAAPDVLPDWERHRAARIADLVDGWLREVGLGSA